MIERNMFIIHGDGITQINGHERIIKALVTQPPKNFDQVFQRLTGINIVYFVAGWPT